MSDIDMKNISNIKVSKECFKTLKKLAIDKEITLQKVVQDIIERAVSKKVNKVESIEE